MDLGMKCPVCGEKLSRTSFRDRIRFGCPGCGGSLAAMGVLRSLCGSPALVNELWKNSAGAADSPDKKCPCCKRPMKQCTLSGNGAALELDLCRSCQMVWFDPGELCCITLPDENKTAQLPPKARKIMAEYRIRRVAAAGNTSPFRDESFEEAPAEIWKIIPGILGFPVEMAPGKERPRFPWITLGSAVLCLAVFMLTAPGGLAEAVRRYGFLPAAPFREQGMTIFTSMFLHGSVWQLIGNLYFLLCFGDDVEEELGTLKMTVLLFISALSALLFQSLTGSGSALPCIGASGFISGLTAFYAITFPWRRLGLYCCRRNDFLRTFDGFGWVSYPAWLLFAVWSLFQVLILFISAPGETSAAAYAALPGGALPGAVWAICQRFSRK